VIDLSETTAIVSAKIDSRDRLRNMALLLKYFEAFYTGYEIIIVEQDSQSRLEQLLSHRQGVFHYFIENDACHTKSKNLNLAASLSGRRYLLVWDVDCFVPPTSLVSALTQADSGADFVLPFNGIMVQIRKQAIDEQMAFATLQLPFFSKLYQIRPPKYDVNLYEPLYGTMISNAIGGVKLCDRKQYFLAGGMNENFNSWGLEDVEFDYRIHKLGYKTGKVEEGNCYHFEHVRITDSLCNNFYKSNDTELTRVRAMSKTDLRRYVNAGFKSINLDGEKEVVMINTPSAYLVKLKAE